MAYAGDRRGITTLDLEGLEPREWGARLREIQERESGPVVTYRLDSPEARSEQPAPRRSPWPAPADELRRLVDEGLTNHQIAERYGVTYNAVATRLKELGIKRAPGQRGALIREGKRAAQAARASRAKAAAPSAAVPETAAVTSASDPIERFTAAVGGALREAREFGDVEVEIRFKIARGA